MPALTTFVAPTLKLASARFALMTLFAFAALAALAPAARAQFNTPTVDGSIAPGEYGDHVENQNQKTSGGQVWYMTWDDTNLYVGITNANLAEGAVIYIDTNPLTAPRGGTNSDGSLSGFNYDNANFSTLPFRADFVAYFKNGYREFRRADGSGGWSSQTTFFGSYADNGAGNVRELAIPWNDITGGAGRPPSFNFFGYLVSAGGFVYGQVPPSNPSGSIGTSATADRFYRVLNTGDGTSTEPFSNEFGNCVAPPSDMVAWWTGNAYRDDIQGTNHLTLKNGATFASGKVRSAFSLDGVDDYAEAPDSASLSVTGSLTLDAWISLSAYPTGNDISPIVSKGNTLNGEPEGSYVLGVKSDGAPILCVFGAGVGQCIFGIGGPPIPLNTFTHVAGVFDSGTQTLRLYVNGVDYGSASGIGFSTIQDTDEPLLIGATDYGNPGVVTRQFFGGLIDEVEIFSRALGAAEVNAIFRADNAGKCAVDLQVTKSNPTPNVFLGELFVYEIQVSNEGNLDATNVVVTDTLPAGVAYVSDTGGCSVVGSQVTCPLGNMLGGGGDNFNIVVRGTAGGVQTNLARVSSPEPDLRPGNDKDFDNTTVVKIKSFAFAPASGTGGCSGAAGLVNGTVTFSHPAPRDGSLTLSSNNTSAAEPTTSSVSFLAGDTQVSIPLSLYAVSSNTPVIITATLDTNYGPVTAPFTVKPILIQSFTLSQNTVTGGNSVDGTVTLTCSPAQDTPITLTTNRPNVTTLPGAFQVDAGQPSGTFTIQTNPVNAPTTATITATLNGKTFTQKLTVVPGQE